MNEEEQESAAAPTGASATQTASHSETHSTAKKSPNDAPEEKPEEKPEENKSEEKPYVIKLRTPSKKGGAGGQNKQPSTVHLEPVASEKIQENKKEEEKKEDHKEESLNENAHFSNERTPAEDQEMEELVQRHRKSLAKPAPKVNKKV